MKLTKCKLSKLNKCLFANKLRVNHVVLLQTVIGHKTQNGRGLVSVFSVVGLSV